MGHMGGEVEEYIRSNYSFNATFVQQPDRKGLGHAVYLARDHVRPGPLLVVLGDTLFSADLGPVLEGKTSRIAVMETDDPQRFGIVELRGKEVVGIIEKPSNPPSNLAVIGRYILTPDIFDIIRETPPGKNGEVQLTDAIMTQAQSGCVMAYKFKGRRFDCGSVDGFIEATNYCYENIYKRNDK